MKKRIVTTAYKRMNAFDDIRVLCKKVVYIQEAPVIKKTSTVKKAFSYGPILSVVAVIFIFTFSMNSVFASSTISYFSDVERSLNNLFHAGSLDFTVALAPDESSNIKLTAGAASVTIIPTVTPGVGDFPLAYKVHVEKTGGTNDAFCNAIDVSATAPSFTYTGKLMAFLQGTTTIVGPLSLSLSLPSNSGFTIADNCMVDVVYSGWVDGQTEGIQYHDIERLSLFISDPPGEVTATSTPTSDSAAVNPEAESVPQTDATTTPPVDTVSTGGETPPPTSDTPPPADTPVPAPADTTTTPPTDTTTPDVPPTDPVQTPDTTTTPVDSAVVDTPPAPESTQPDVAPAADSNPPPAPTSEGVGEPTGSVGSDIPPTE